MLAFQPLLMYLSKKPTKQKNFNFKLGSEGNYFMDTHKTFASHALAIWKEENKETQLIIWQLDEWVRLASK